jgi:transposase-like protein
MSEMRWPSLHDKKNPRYWTPEKRARMFTRAQRMEDAGVTRGEMARRLGVSTQTIRQWLGSRNRAEGRRFRVVIG